MGIITPTVARVKESADWMAAIRLASPERPADRSVPFEQSPAAVRFTVPEVKVYEIAVVEFSAP